MPLTLLALTLWIVLPQVPASHVLVTAENARATIFKGRSVIEVDVVNHTSELVTAWKVDVTYKLSNGTAGQQAKLTDMYEAAAGIPGRGRLPTPRGGATTEMFPIVLPAGVTVDSISASVVSAVFADGTWIGDSRAVQEVFEHRRRDENAWALVLDSVRIGQGSGGYNGLKKALEHLMRTEQDDYDNPIKTVMRRNLQRAIAQDKTIRVTPNEFLREWFARAESRRHAASRSRDQKGQKMPAFFATWLSVLVRVGQHRHADRSAAQSTRDDINQSAGAADPRA